MITVSRGAALKPRFSAALYAIENGITEASVFVDSRARGDVKFSLTHCQVFRLLCRVSKSNLSTVRCISSQRRKHMTHENFSVRFAQALLAITVTVASVLAFQFAMLMG